jgi:hypothetical protein
MGSGASSIRALRLIFIRPIFPVKAESSVGTSDIAG